MKTEISFWATMAIVFTSTVLTHQSPAAEGPRAAVRMIDDLLEWTVKTAPDVVKREDEAIEVLQQTLRRMKAQGDDLGEVVVELLKNNIDDLPLSVFRDDTLLRFATRQPKLVESSLEIAQRAPVQHLGARLTALVDECPNHAEAAIRALAGPLPKEDVGKFLRGLAGRQLSNKQIRSVIQSFREVSDGRVAGDMFEILARRQISAGTMKPAIALRKGTKVIDGRFNQIHGIDGIGVADDGVPYVFEFTIDRAKDLNKTEQLTPAWVADRWNRLLDKKPDIVSQLKEMGVQNKYLTHIDESTAASFHRKLVAENRECLSESNRLVAGLEMDDLLVLGS